MLAQAHGVRQSSFAAAPSEKITLGGLPTLRGRCEFSCRQGQQNWLARGGSPAYHPAVLQATGAR